MSGRFYFLKAGDSGVYVLRFTGFRDKSGRYEIKPTR